MALLALLLLCGGFLWAVAVVLTAWTLLRPARLTPARAMARLRRMSPADIGLRFVDFDVAIDDPPRHQRLLLRGWWIEASTPSTRTAVIIHGYGDSRAGALAWAPVWLAAGCHVLLFDVRAHGESGGTITTAGIRECDDLQAVLNELSARKPSETAQMFLFGVSLGATIALATAEKFDGLSGVVLESPVADFVHGAITQSALLGLPGPAVVVPAVRLAEWWIGERASTLRPAELIARSLAPVLAMVPNDDPFLPADHADELRRAIEMRRQRDGVSQVLDFEGAAHLLAAQVFPDRYAQALQQFCNRCTDSGLARVGGGRRGSPDQPSTLDVDSR